MNLVAAPLTAGSPIVDPRTGALTPVGLRFLLALWERTGGGSGVSAVVVSGNADGATMGLFDLPPDAPPADLSLLTHDAPDAVDIPPALLFDNPIDPAPDMGAAALFALVLGD